MHGVTPEMATRRKALAERHKGGKIVQPRHHENDQPWVRWRKIKDHAIAMGVHPDMGSVLGRLSLAGVLTDKEAAAGIWVTEVIAKYERLHGMPRRSAASPAYERFYSGARYHGDTIGEHERRANKAKRAWDRLWRVVPPKPSLASTVLEDVCINDIEVNSAHHRDLAALLRLIAKERGFL